MAVKTHEFNTRWWGKPVGIVTDTTFFDLPAGKQIELLQDFSWVEFKTQLEPTLPYNKIAAAGFVQVDTQFPLTIDLTPIDPLPESEGITVVFCDQSPFSVAADEMRIFKRERISILPGITNEMINARYTQWGNALIQAQPESCLQVIRNGQVQGWFLSTREDEVIDFTLAMLHTDSTMRGRQLYRSALAAYRDRGFAKGTSSFSSMNLAVMNIFSGLGAKFVQSVGCWFRFNPLS